MSSLRPVVLVTGAAHRVGRAIAVHLAESGFDVAVHYRSSASDADAAVEACRAHGAKAQGFAADLGNPETPDVLVQSVTTAFGRLDALVNSAASMAITPLDSVTPAEWDAVFAVNLRAPFFLSLAAGRVMAEGGAIVNLADHLAEDSMRRLVPHGISKAGVVAMTKHLAKQLAPRIRVNAVEPGAVLPPADWADDARERFIRETPLKRLGTPDDVAAAVLYLLRASYVTGHVLVVDGGRRVR
jgi:pteridine reductase